MFKTVKTQNSFVPNVLQS